jgi:hypothetical protein
MAILMVSPVGITGLLRSKSDMSPILLGSKKALAAMAWGSAMKHKQVKMTIAMQIFFERFMISLLIVVVIGELNI